MKHIVGILGYWYGKLVFGTWRNVAIIWGGGGVLDNWLGTHLLGRESVFK